MAIIRFDPTWTGTQSGTFEQPYVSWAGRTLAEGDSWVQKYGTTTNAPLSPFGSGGALGNRCFIGVYDPDTGDIMTDVKGGARIDATGNSMGVYIGPTRDYITLSGFEIFGAGDYCIYKDSPDVTTGQYFWVENCILHDSLGMGADLRGKGNKVLNCDVYNNYNDGLFIVGDDAEIGWCNVYGNAKFGATGDGVQFYNSSNFYVHDCNIEHRAPSKQALIANFDSVPGTTGGRIINTKMVCRQYALGSTLAEQKTLMVVNPNVTVFGCYIEGGQFGAYLEAAGTRFEANTVVATGQGPVIGIAIRGADNLILGNTIVGAGLGTYGIDHSSSTYTGTVIRGNAVKGWPYGIRTTTSGFTYSHNAFEDCTLRNSNAAGTEGAAGTGDVTDPLLLGSDYEPALTSPLLGAATGLGPFAYGRRARYNPPAIGAKEPLRIRSPRL